MNNRELHSILSSVIKPGRYAGGEYGEVIKDGASVSMALSYPDLYEIGMSNYAVRLLYTLLNSIDGFACERVFAPDLDLEDYLRKTNLPLFSLERKRPLSEFDLLGFSLGHELTFTNMLNIMELGGLPVLRAERGPEHPIVIIGGPAAANPAPLDDFIDAAFFGEAEDFVLTVMPDLVRIKKTGGKKQDLLEAILAHPSVHSPLTPCKKARKAVWMDFGDFKTRPVMPVPSIRTVQNNGVVEIMRGCPNKCRFCHASFFYRPFRYKDPALVLNEVDANILSCGYREVTLSSLSSGDYDGIQDLFPFLNARYRKLGVSFSLPSLRIDSLDLPVLKEISQVRRSGLTFAVETPLNEWQKRINKSVPFDKTMSILNEAKGKGWRLAKFYFMIGLPVGEGDQAGAIIDFIHLVRKTTGLNMNVNISTFIPKAHTPFQWVPQITEEDADNQISAIRKACRNRTVNIGFHSPFQSVLEGLFARGDGRVSALLLSAYKNGARFDAWEDRVRKEIWTGVFHDSGWDVPGHIHSARDLDSNLPWDNLLPGVSKEYLKTEFGRALRGELSSACVNGCPDPCGSCNYRTEIRNRIDAKNLNAAALPDLSYDEAARTRILAAFSKSGNAAYLSHLDILLIMERSLLRARYFTCHTKGFNPKPIIEFANPIPLGVTSMDEIMQLEIHNFDSTERFTERLNAALPSGIRIEACKILTSKESNRKRLSLASQYWGSDYFIISDSGIEALIPFFHKINLLVTGQGLVGEADFSRYLDAIEVFFLVEDGIVIRFKKIEKKGITVLNLVKDLCGCEPGTVGMNVMRAKTLAVNRRMAERMPASFFDVLG